MGGLRRYGGPPDDDVYSKYMIVFNFFFSKGFHFFQMFLLAPEGLQTSPS